MPAPRLKLILALALIAGIIGAVLGSFLYQTYLAPHLPYTTSRSASDSRWERKTVVGTANLMPALSDGWEVEVTAVEQTKFGQNSFPSTTYILRRDASRPWPTPTPIPTPTPLPTCQSNPKSLVPGRSFDIVSMQVQQQYSLGYPRVIGRIKNNNCDSSFTATIVVTLVNASGAPVAATSRFALAPIFEPLEERAFDLRIPATVVGYSEGIIGAHASVE